MRPLILSIAIGTVMALGAPSRTFAVSLPSVDRNAHPANIEPIDYVSNGHHYQHRQWDKNHKRWRYY